MPIYETQAAIDWAHVYDGYRRLASSPQKLEELLRSARNSFATRGAIPDWCGVDLLRGWAFYLAREDHHPGGGTLGPEWEAVLCRLASHPDASARDRPPLAMDFVLPTVFSTEPRQHKVPDFLMLKQARLFEPHVAPINEFVERIRIERGGHVPYVDPDSGGIAARALFVLESPAGPAALGSTMLSADNNDGTANNVWLAYQSSGMPRSMGLHWNAVPWYVGDGKKEASVAAADVEQGRQFLLQLLDLATAVRVVVALGKQAQRSVAGAATELAARQIHLIHAPHPSPRLAGVTRGHSLQKVNEAFAEALRIVRSPCSSPHTT